MGPGFRGAPCRADIRRRIIASCLVGCAQGSLGALSDWIEGWMILQAAARRGSRSEERRAEPKFRRRIIASCLVGYAQGSVGTLWIDSCMTCRLLPGED